ncbi:sensor histidine kinase [Streptomyces sp. NPDC057011]
MRTDLTRTAHEEARKQAVSVVVLEADPGSAPDASRGSTPVESTPAAVDTGDPASAARLADHPGSRRAPVDDSAGEAEVSAHDGYRVTARVDLGPVGQTLRTMTLWAVPLTLALVLIGAWLTWTAVGRVLVPVEALRREVSEITATDLHRRLAVPKGRDEIGRLAVELNSTLERFDRAVGRLRTFTGDASHELRSPLTTLRTRLEFALARPARTDWPRTAARALEDTEQIQELVEDLLLLARLDAHRPGREAEVDLAALARAHACTGVRSPVGTPVTVSVDAPGRAAVLGTASHLNRLITNLVGNACRHARGTVRVSVAPHAGRVTLEVADDGPGIAAADRERVFERFTRLDAARSRDAGGAGLGLAIARAIAAAHRGTLTAEEPSAPAGGARFVLSLPAVDETPAPRSA